MPRVKRGLASHRKHKKLFSQVKGFRGKRRNTVKLATNAFMKKGTNAYVSRRLAKRDFHQLWVLRINAACRQLDIRYSRFIYGMELAGICINRKMLAELAVSHPAVFKEIVEKVKAILPPPGQAPDLEKIVKKGIEIVEKEAEKETPKEAPLNTAEESAVKKTKTVRKTVKK